MLKRVYRLEIQSVMLLFSTQLCDLLPLQPSLWFPSLVPTPFPVSKYSKVYTDSVWLGWGGCWVVLEPIFCRSLTLCSEQIQNLQNYFATPNRNLVGEGASDHKYLPQCPLQYRSILDNDIWRYFPLIFIFKFSEYTEHLNVYYNFRLWYHSYM